MAITRRPVLAALAASLLLTACGFHLRGTGQTATLPFKSVFVRGGTPLVNDLRTYISVGNTPVTAVEKDAAAVIEVVSEARDKQVLSVNSQGRVREYTLISRATFQVRTPAGATIMPPTEIQVRRIQNFNETIVLAKESEEVMMYREMQSDLVQQILRRVSAFKPLAQNEQPGQTGQTERPDAAKN